jgi:DNA helicase-2/ATP-dependent DNA helicase PcrA
MTNMSELDKEKQSETENATASPASASPVQPLAASSFPWLDELNPEQRKAVTHGEGPLLIVAGAGTGKTRTLAYRVAWLIANGVDPGRILLLTFTRRAAEEMLKRATSIVTKGTSTTGRIWGGTFHAIANRLLRIYAKPAGLSNDFTVMDQADAEDTMNVLRHEMGLHTKEKRFPRKGTCLAIYSRCVNGTEPLADVLKIHFPWCDKFATELKALFKLYVTRKQDRNVLDYDDLLLYWMQLLSDEKLSETIGGRFDHILVDEYQDTNKVQAEILLGMRRKNKNITVVGDDAQSIYSFRAATVRNMLDFPKQFPGTTIVTLDRNYRSVSPVLDTTNLVIAQAKERYTKNLRSVRGDGQRPRLVTCKDEAQQDKYVVDQVLEHYEQGIPLKRQAVLFRAAHLSDSLEIQLAQRNIPYHKYGGLRFLEAAHVKDLICLLRIIENPRDEMAWFRTLQLMDGIGPSAAATIVKHITAHRNDPRSVASYTPPPAARSQWSRFVSMIEDICSGKLANPASQVERVRKFYDPLLEKIYENPKQRARDIENLERIASGYKSRRSFLTDLQLDPTTSTGDLAGPPMKDEDWLILSTIHSAKGCEWDVVYVIHAADGCIPSDMATGSAEEIEEELRLTYVAMTRARDFLYVTWPLRYYFKWFRHTDKHSYAQLCRFITDDVRATFEEVNLQQGADEDAESQAEPVRDIRARLRDMWE